MNYEKFQSLIIKDYLNHCKAITQNIKRKRKHNEICRQYAKDSKPSHITAENDFALYCKIVRDFSIDIVDNYKRGKITQYIEKA